jgi:hypothetical protein
MVGEMYFMVKKIYSRLYFPILIVWFLNLSGCFIPVPNFSEPEYSTDITTNKNAIDRVTIIYDRNLKVTRFHDPTAYIFLDDQYLVKLEKGEYTRWVVTPGWHKASVQWFIKESNAWIALFSGELLHVQTPSKTESWIYFNCGNDHEQFISIKNIGWGRIPNTYPEHHYRLRLIEHDSLHEGLGPIETYTYIPPYPSENYNQIGSERQEK